MTAALADGPIAKTETSRDAMRRPGRQRRHGTGMDRRAALRHLAKHMTNIAVTED